MYCLDFGFSCFCKLEDFGLKREGHGFRVEDAPLLF